MIDLSPGVAMLERERLVGEALKRTSRTKIAEALARHPGRPGTPALRALLDPQRPSGLTWSRMEKRLRRMIARARLPAPESNIELYNGYFPDLLWRERRVIIEYDSEEHHLGPASFITTGRGTTV